MPSPATRPCQPLLNPVPNGSSGSPFPAPLTSADIPTFDQAPGFGDLAASTLGDAGSDADGFDAAVLALSSSVDQWDTAEAEQDTTLDQILTQLEAADSTSVDSSLTDYTNSFDAGNTIVAGAQGITVPGIGPLDTMWVFPYTEQPTPPSSPGAQVPGQITAGDPPFTWTVKNTIAPIGNGGTTAVKLLTPSDVFTAAQLGTVSPFYSITAPDGHTQWQAQDVTVEVSVNPHAAGNFADTLIFTADYHPFNNVVPRRIAIQVLAKG